MSLDTKFQRLHLLQLQQRMNKNESVTKRTFHCSQNSRTFMSENVTHSDSCTRKKINVLQLKACTKSSPNTFCYDERKFRYANALFGKSVQIQKQLQQRMKYQTCTKRFIICRIHVLAHRFTGSTYSAMQKKVKIFEKKKL